MIVGIDLGTTHSLIGLYGPDGPELIPNALGSLLTPSVVSVDEGDTWLVGQAAKERLGTQGARTAATFKRWMGTDRVLSLGTHRMRAEELSALVLRSLIGDAEAHTGRKVEEAVISVPAYFGDAQRKATRTAGQLAGIRVDRLVNEPTAAALAYGLQQREGGGRFLVFDLGGGTFDVSILEMFDGVMEVHASAGDNYLGGEDFLEALRTAFLRDLKVDAAALPRNELAQLDRRLEVAKRALSSGGGPQVVEMTLKGHALHWEVDETRFAQLVEPLVQRLRTPLERAMRDARLDPAQLDEIVLVGGASRMPLCARLVSRMFGRLPLRNVSPDEAIAMGAAIAAGMKARDERLEEVVLTDVSPHTLGVATSRDMGQGQVVSGVFAPIIERNSTVPVSRAERFQPTRDFQREVQLDIYQGESPRVENNVRLGQLVVPVPNAPAADNEIEVRFTYDINGLLQVEATVLSTRETRELVLESSPGLLSSTEIQARLATLSTLKVHPREQQENQALLARAERLYEELLWARDQLQDAITQFRRILEQQDLRDISRARVDLDAFLGQVERNA